MVTYRPAPFNGRTENKRGIGILKDINLSMEQNSLNQWGNLSHLVLLF